MAAWRTGEHTDHIVYKTHVGASSGAENRNRRIAQFPRSPYKHNTVPSTSHTSISMTERMAAHRRAHPQDPISTISGSFFYQSISSVGNLTFHKGLNQGWSLSLHNILQWIYRPLWRGHRFWHREGDILSQEYIANLFLGGPISWWRNQISKSWTVGRKHDTYVRINAPGRGEALCVGLAAGKIDCNSEGVYCKAYHSDENFLDQEELGYRPE